MVKIEPLSVFPKEDLFYDNQKGSFLVACRIAPRDGKKWKQESYGYS